MKILLLAILLLAGCAAQFGPDGKILKYDICGFVGGVALEAGVGQMFNLRLGCTDPADVELEPDSEE